MNWPVYIPSAAIMVTWTNALITAITKQKTVGRPTLRILYL